MSGVEALETSTGGYDVEAVREDFPILDQLVHGKPLVFLDSGASSQKPRPVIDAMDHYYYHDHANVHRGVHTLSQRATDAYEAAREKVRRFINAGDEREIIFVRGTTEGINLVAQSYGRANLGQGDTILVSEMEHHANIVPWQLLAEQVGARIDVIPVNDAGELIQSEYSKLLEKAPAIVAITHVSNALGTIVPVKKMVAEAHAAGAVVVVDGAQAVPHLKVDVQDLDCDFYAFSAHKMYGPTGIGVLYGKRALLDAMPPWQGGGEMIKLVSFEKTTFNDLPHKFEAGTPDIAGAVGLGAAVDYLESVGLDNISRHEHELLEYATAKVAGIEGVKVIGTARDKAGILSFVLDGIHPHDIGTIIDHEGVAVRTGHHCAQPVMKRFGVAATARASLGMYNNRADIDALVAGIKKVKAAFAG